MSPHIVNKLYIHNQYRPTYSSNLKLMTSRCQINELWLPKEQVFRQHLPSRQDWAILKCENVVLEIPYEAQCYPWLITLSWPHPCIMYKTCNGHVSPGLNKIQTQPNTHLWIPQVWAHVRCLQWRVARDSHIHYLVQKNGATLESDQAEVSGHGELSIYHIQFQWMCSTF